MTSKNENHIEFTDGLLSIVEAARFSNVTRLTIENWLKGKGVSDQLSGIRVAGRTLIHRDTLSAFLDARQARGNSRCRRSS